MSEATKRKTEMQIPLSFPVFYQSVIKERLTLKQYDAVNLLLLGKRYSECVEIQISQSMAANYVSGKKKISKDITTQLLTCSLEEYRRRLMGIGLQNLDQGVHCLKRCLYNREIVLNEYDRARLLHIARTDVDYYSFLSEAFLLAIKCPAQNVRPLTEEEKNLIFAYQEPCLFDDIDKELTPEQIAESERLLSEPSRQMGANAAGTMRNRGDCFEGFDTALYRTKLINLPQDYNFIQNFFYGLTGVKNDYKRDNLIADIVRPFYERATLHVVSVEEWCVLVGASCFRDFIPRKEFSTLCILIEGSESAMEGFQESAFHNDSDFAGAEILFRLNEAIDPANLRVSWVFLTGEKR